MATSHRKIRKEDAPSDIGDIQSMRPAITITRPETHETGEQERTERDDQSMTGNEESPIDEASDADHHRLCSVGSPSAVPLRLFQGFQKKELLVLSAGEGPPRPRKKKSKKEIVDIRNESWGGDELGLGNGVEKPKDKQKKKKKTRVQGYSSAPMLQREDVKQAREQMLLKRKLEGKEHTGEEDLTEVKLARMVFNVGSYTVEGLGKKKAQNEDRLQVVVDLSEQYGVRCAVLLFSV